MYDMDTKEEVKLNSGLHQDEAARCRLARQNDLRYVSI
jgi:hypothetical protein